MKKARTIFAMTLGILLLAPPSTASAQRRLIPASQHTPSAHKAIRPSKTSSVTPQPLKAGAKKAGWAEDILVDEDFSALTSGTMNLPDTTKELGASNDGYIDAKLTKDGTWGGYGVYSAGGAIYLKTYNPQDPAYLLTPLGDYSGEITITCKVKALPNYLPVQGGWAKVVGASLNISPCINGYSVKNLARTDDKNDFYDVRLYDNQGWTQVTYKFKNYSANNDGYIEFSTEGAIIIDDVRITTTPSFLASPVIDGLTDFQKDQFTVSWQPLRKAFNYYVDLYKKVYTSDSEEVLNQDFEEFTPSGDWKSNVDTASAEVGEDKSYGLVLRNGDTLTTPITNPTYTDASFYMKVVAPSAPVYYGQKFINGMVCIDVLTNEGWSELGQFYCSGFEDGDYVTMSEELDDFPNSFNAFRIRPEDMDDDQYVILDNMEVKTNRPFNYELVMGEASVDNGGDYTYYDITKSTSYTFRDLDAESEYYYGVRGHYMRTFSSRVLHHAMGVATPESMTATDIDSRGTFTANWNAVDKAQGYTVRLYRADEVKTDNPSYAILDEDFSKVTEEVTSATDPDDPEIIDESGDLISLDEYTNLPGWTGTSTAVVQGMMGSYDGRLCTPYLDLGNADKFSISIKAHGMNGDMLLIRDGKSTYGLTFDEEGNIDQTIEMPVENKQTKLSLSSYNEQTFVVDQIKVTQDLKVGQRVYTWWKDAESAETHYTFDGLADYCNDVLAYEIYSHYTLEGETVTSLRPSDMILVDLAAGTSVSGIDGVDNSLAPTKVIARYNAAGQRISEPCKGINILVLSNGRTMKVMR